MLSEPLFTKILNAFSALARSGRLIPIDDHEKERRDRSRFLIDCPHDKPWLSINIEKYNRIVSLLSCAYPNQLSDEQIDKLLRSTIRPLLDVGSSAFKPIDIRSGLTEGLQQIQSEICECTLMLFVDGLIMNTPHEVQLGSVSIHPFHLDTDYARILQVECERANVEVLPRHPYFKFQGKGHIDRLVSIANQEADTALNIFRLFNASWYCDKGPHVAFPKQISVFVASARNVRKIYAFNSDGQQISSHMKPQHFNPFVLEQRTIKHMQRLGLDKINQLVSDPVYNNDDKAKRIRYSIHWFAKGTDADSLADSFLMYAIAAEALLSEGRTSQETYARRMAGLLARDHKYRSGPFSSQLNEPRNVIDPNEWFVAFNDRLIDLFGFRNRIAHGLETSGEPQHIGKLVDFEAFTRGAILSFASGSWHTLSEYTEWLDSSLNTRFEPVI